MKDLMKSDIRSMILTSGTLSPLQSFKAELQMYVLKLKTNVAIQY